MHRSMFGAITRIILLIIWGEKPYLLSCLSLQSTPWRRVAEKLRRSTENRCFGDNVRQLFFRHEAFCPNDVCCGSTRKTELLFRPFSGSGLARLQRRDERQMQKWRTSSSPVCASLDRKEQQTEGNDTCNDVDFERNEEDSNDDSDGWEPGNVQSDFALLEAAISKTRADENLEATDRMALLDAIARGRRCLASDIAKYVLGPMVISVIFGKFYSSSSAIRAFIRFMDVQYWCFVVAPTLFLYRSFFKFSTPWRCRRNGEHSRLLAQDDEGDLFSWMTDDEPKVSRKDYNRCLVDLMTSAVVGHAIVQCATTIFRMWNTMLAVKLSPTLSRSSQIIFHGGGILPSTSQLISRLGLAASMYQYPRLAYEVNRLQQARPMERRVVLLQTYMSLVFLSLPVGIACDLARILVFVNSRTSRNGVFTTLSIVAAIMSMLSPLVHIIAWLKSVKVKKCTDISLSENYNSVDELLNDSNKLDQRMRWRWNLTWREPMHVLQVVKDWILLFAAEYSRNDGSKKLDSLGNANLKRLVFFPQTEYTNIIELHAKHMKENPELNKVDRSSRIDAAMDRVKMRHTKNFENKSFEDPLGIAVHQTLGIGLSFDYDHDSRISQGEEPSLYRLRARAAKSAVRRVQELYNSDRARATLGNITGNAAKAQKAREMKADAQREVNELAYTLLHLTPTITGPPDGVDVDVQQIRESVASKLSVSMRSFSDPNNWVASHESPPDWYETIMRDLIESEDPMYSPEHEPASAISDRYLSKHEVSSTSDHSDLSVNTTGTGPTSSEDDWNPKAEYFA